jgi:aminoglycoside phosphotransferase (APT) family kinase protein
MTERVLARGRASEVVALGDGRVLRRFLRGGDPAREAAVMAHARRHGYPVPAVHAVTAEAMVLDRVDGPTMAADLRAHPDRLDVHAATLARLHDALHRIEAPGGGTLLHDRNVTGGEAAAVRALR